MDVDGTEVSQSIRNEVSQVLNVLNQARIKYAVWGAAACVFHGGQWLWESKDHEILIEDWFDGQSMLRAVNLITACCSLSWEYEARFNAAMWAAVRGDDAPHRPIRRFKHKRISNFGIILVPSFSVHVQSMHHDDLDNEEEDPVWIYPNLKNLVESLLKLWSYEGRNSALLELADLVGARRLNEAWEREVGLEVSVAKRPGRWDLPSEKEMWEEVVRMALTNSDRQRASARFQVRRREREAMRTLGVQSEQSDG